MERQDKPRYIDTLLATYGASHLQIGSAVLHCVGMPVIVFSLLGLAWAIHPLAALALAGAAVAGTLKLSPPFALGMLVLLAPMLAILRALPPAAVLPLSLAIFVLAWVGQFIGQLIEGARPTMLATLHCLLVGPLFVLGMVYRRLRLAY